jgi:uncharacterized protein YprB with RNaseH-like and TPR domain
MDGMDLRERLARLDRTTHRRAAEVAATARPLDYVDYDAWVRQLGLERADPDSAWTRDYPVDAEPGAPSIDVDLTAIIRDPRAAKRPEDLLLLDTETTGLAGGTGSLPFVVGLAWWEAAGLRVRQLFLPAPGEEEPLLAALERCAAGFRAVVSYNGASFDWPLLRTRALLARREDPLRRLARWDLLPAARRLWGRRLVDLRQPTVEARVCGRPRSDDDLPGALIPETYFRFLRGAGCADIARVLEHNRADLVGMAHILAAVVAAGAQLEPPERRGEAHVAWQDAWARARIWETRRDVSRAAGWIEYALADPTLALPRGAGAAPPPERLFGDAIRLLKRTRRWEQVRAIVERALAFYGDRPWLAREAAILYEHRLGELERAFAHARELGDPNRLRRLRRKLDVAAGCRGGDASL